MPKDRMQRAFLFAVIRVSAKCVQLQEHLVIMRNNLNWDGIVCYKSPFHHLHAQRVTAGSMVCHISTTTTTTNGIDVCVCLMFSVAARRARQCLSAGGWACDHTISRNNAAAVLLLLHRSVSVCAGEQLVRRWLARWRHAINRQLSPCNVFVLLLARPGPTGRCRCLPGLVRRPSL